MFISRLVSHPRNYTKYTWLVTLLLLFSVSVSAHIFLPQPTTRHAFGLQKNQNPSRLFLIAVIDSDDETIGGRCTQDLDNIQSAFKDLAEWLDAEMTEPKIIQGSDFSKAAVSDAVDNWLSSQELTAADIVVFYYSGHGFRYPTDASRFPRMWLKTGDDKDVEKNNLSIEEDVYNHIIKMGAGFNLVLTDCCNTTITNGNVNFDNVMVPTRKREVPRRNEDNNSNDDDHTDKFFPPGQPVSILANAADKGEYAAGKADVGGFFTNFFREALEDGLYLNLIEPSWESVFKSADEKASYWARSASCPEAKHTEQGRCVQTVAFKIEH